MRNIFLEKSYRKRKGEPSLRAFYKKSKLSISLNQQPDILQSLFLLYVQVEVYQNILKLRCWPLVSTLYKAFLKNRNRSGTSLLTSFSPWLLKNMFLTLCSTNQPNFNVRLPLLLEILGNMCIVIIFSPVCDTKKF